MQALIYLWFMSLILSVLAFGKVVVIPNLHLRQGKTWAVILSISWVIFFIYFGVKFL